MKKQQENSQNIDSGTSNESHLNPLRQIAEAEVIAVEKHPKQAGMFRVSIRLHGNSVEMSPSVELQSFELADAVIANIDNEKSDKEDWRAEVDAWIEGVKQAPEAVPGDEVLNVHEDTLIAMRLLKGRRLSAEEWQVLLQEQSREDAYRAAIAMLSRKARTSRELADALKRKGYDPETIQACLQRLRDRRMLDDASYAKRFAEQRTIGHRKGSRLIRQELLQRGISRDEAEQALAAIDERVELEAAFALARKKWPQLKGDHRERKMKLVGYLLRRGYPGDVVRKVVEQVISEAHEMDFDNHFMEDSEGSEDWGEGEAERNDLLD